MKELNFDEFTPIRGYEERYYISKFGDVYSTKSKRLLKPFKNEHGYLVVELWCNYQRKSVKLHRLVAETFLENPNALKEINHKDGNKENNCVENLEWCTRSENLKHAYKIGLMKPWFIGTNRHPRSKQEEVML